jgi:streptomycin 6-kinase
MQLPEAFLKTLHDIHDDANEWLESLLETLTKLEKQWQIRIQTKSSSLTRLSYNLVMFASGTDGTSYVLKMSPISDEFTREVEAIKLYNGDGMAKLIKSDTTLAAMLLERLEPGISLWNTPPDNAKRDDEAKRIIANLMKRLWRKVPEPHTMRTLESWTQALARYQGNDFPKPILDKAKYLLKDLLPTHETVLLHGDLHHDNVLSANREPYLAIDPKGLVGNRVYDVTPAMCNPYTPGLSLYPELASILERRASIFSEMLAIDKQEIFSWTFVQYVLGSIWSLEDRGEIDNSQRFIEALEKLLV